MPTRKSVCEDDRTTNPIQGQQQFKNKVDVGICESHRRTSLLVKRFSKMLPLHAINSMIFNFKIIEKIATAGIMDTVKQLLLFMSFGRQWHVTRERTIVNACKNIHK
ncbi:uncharacterized protein LOC143153115 isoform X1 [Ptiloglossa arizonensis]|uniref:uncharacterized protein LOC143153115 isoform X1 n=1 Tax=Ptiloglossa arizonensis TaxID=3350558 RepID=UPI003FA1115E